MPQRLSECRARRRSVEKVCQCGATFCRRDESDREWDATGRCAVCRVDALKQRIRSGSVQDTNGCWIWQRSTKNGYGQTSVSDRPTYTHRLSYELYVGPIPDGMDVCHTCDVKPCNNPAHFFLGTPADNTHDMWRKGRGRKPPVHRGLANSNAKLADVDLDEIRRLDAEGLEQREVARQFGCSQSTVWRIVRGHVRGPEKLGLVYYPEHNKIAATPALFPEGLK